MHQLLSTVGYTIPLAQNHGKEPYMTFETESLLVIAKIQPLEFEQRVGLDLDG